MSAIRRFMAIDDGNSIFSFKIDTTKIVVGATDGSQLNTQFIMPFNSYSSITTNVIMRVSDGRPDVILTNANRDYYKTLTFSTPGIYDIKLVGLMASLGFNSSPDSLKIIEINSFGNVSFAASAFLNCINLIIKATDQPYIRGNQVALFRGIKGFDNAVNLSLWDFSNVTSASYLFYQVSLPMSSVPQGFMNIVNMDRLYQAAPISTMSRIEVISSTVTTAQWLFYQTNYRGRIIFKTPNLNNMSNFLYGISNPPSLGEVDIRSVTAATNFITLVMTTANVDATLLGWVNNFDWSGIAPVTNKVTLDFKGSTHTNSTAVNNAKAFLIAKGYVFANLTAV